MIGIQTSELLHSLSVETPRPQTLNPERSVWRYRDAWYLLLPLVILAAGGFPLSQNNPEVYLTGSDSILTAPSYEPYGSILQSGVWIVMVFIARPWLGRALRLLSQNRLIASLMALILLSSLWAPQPLVSLRRGILVDLTLFLAFYLSVRFSQREQLQLVFGVGVFTIIASYLTALLLPGTNRGFGDGWQGMFGHKNDLGMFLSFLLSAAFFMKLERSSSRILRVVILLAGVGLIGLSESRGGWLIAAILLAYATAATFIDRFERQNAYLVSLVSLPVLAGLGALLTANLGTIAYALGKDPGLTNRTIIWRAVWPSILKRPLLGYGYGGFWNGLVGESGNVVLLVGTSIAHAHNGAFNIWLQIGLIGLGLTILSTIIGLWHVIRCFGARPNRFYLWYGSLLVMTVLGSVDESFFLTQNMLTTTLWALACIELRKTVSDQASLLA